MDPVALTQSAPARDLWAETTRAATRNSGSLAAEKRRPGDPTPSGTRGKRGPQARPPPTGGSLTSGDEPPPPGVPGRPTPRTAKRREKAGAIRTLGAAVGSIALLDCQSAVWWAFLRLPLGQRARPLLRSMDDVSCSPAGRQVGAEDVPGKEAAPTTVANCEPANRRFTPGAHFHRFRAVQR
jgi:hypothetical protein